MDSQPGDWVGGGITQTYVSPDATFQLFSGYPPDSFILAIEDGDSRWWVHVGAPGNARLAVGTYAAATSVPSTRFGTLSISGNGRGCDLTGRFVVLEIAYAPDGRITSFAADVACKEHTDIERSPRRRRRRRRLDASDDGRHRQAVGPEHDIPLTATTTGWQGGLASGRRPGTGTCLLVHQLRACCSRASAPTSAVPAELHGDGRAELAV